MASGGLPGDNDASAYIPYVPAHRPTGLLWCWRHSARQGWVPGNCHSCGGNQRGPQTRIRVKVLISKYILESILGKGEGRIIVEGQKTYGAGARRRSRRVTGNAAGKGTVSGWELCMIFQADRKPLGIWHRSVIWYPVRGAWRKIHYVRRQAWKQEGQLGGFIEFQVRDEGKPTPGWWCWRYREMVQFKIYICIVFVYKLVYLIFISKYIIMWTLLWLKLSTHSLDCFYWLSRMSFLYRLLLEEYSCFTMLC